VRDKGRFRLTDSTSDTEAWSAGAAGGISKALDSLKTDYVAGTTVTARVGNGISSVLSRLNPKSIGGVKLKCTDLKHLGNAMKFLDWSTKVANFAIGASVQQAPAGDLALTRLDLIGEMVRKRSVGVGCVDPAILKGGSMKRTVFLFLLLSFQGLKAGEARGYIQIKCGPGVRIFLDGDFKGVTNTDSGGLILQDISVGEHSLKAVKEGFPPQVSQVTVTAGAVVVFTVKPFVPKIEISEEGREESDQKKLRVGTLLIQSLPVECVLSIDKLGLSGVRKKKDKWRAKKVPAGRYVVRAAALGKTLEIEVRISQDRETELFFNFVEGKVVDRGKERERAERAQWGGYQRMLPGVVPVRSTTYPSISGLAPGSREAQARQRRAVSDLGLPLEVKSKKSGIVFRLIPAGEFMMGSPPSERDRDPSEGPRHRVRITKPFYLGKYEVTQEEWQRVMGNNPPDCKSAGGRAAVAEVSWNDCREFCRKLCELEGVPEGTYRLPTEAEWEYACRAGTETAYYFGDSSSELGRYAWYAWYDVDSPLRVGQKKPNAFGLYDMHGNVWEWCQDWYDWGYYKNSPEADPQGPVSGGLRIFRGGCWDGDAEDCRSARRSRCVPVYRGIDLGLRLLRTAK